MERVLGKRGELPKGIHVLCPLKTKIALEKEKLERRLNRLKDRLERAHEKYSKYKNKDCKGALACLENDRGIREKINETKKQLQEVLKIADDEICTRNGWYFYSAMKIKQVFDKKETNEDN